MPPSQSDLLQEELQCMRLSTLNRKAGKGSVHKSLLLRVDPLQEELQCMCVSTLHPKQ
jgi:hypothetical protein